MSKPLREQLAEQPEVLERLYHGQGMTQEEVGRVFGVSETVAHKALKIAGVKSRTKGSRSKSKHHNWKNGIRDYLGNWDAQRRKAIERDGRRCQSCGINQSNTSSELELDVHHHKPYASFDDPEEANRLENLITLCRYCHRKYEGGLYGPFAGERYR